MKKLTKEQVEIIKLRYPNEGASLLAEEFCIKPGTIHACARRNNISVKDRLWEESQLKILKENYHLGAKKVATILNMPVNKVVAMANRLKLGKKRRKWNSENIKILKSRYEIDGPEILSEKLGFTKLAILQKASSLGLSKSLKRWTKEEDNILVEKIHTHTYIEISKILGRTEMGVCKRAEYLGLRRISTSKIEEIKEKWEEIGEKYISGVPVSILRKEYNVPKSTIEKVLNNLKINPKDYDIDRFKKYKRKRLCKWVGDFSSTKFDTIKKSANNRCLDFNLTMEYLWDLFLKQDKKCSISGMDIFFEDSEHKASLDRIDPLKGYIIGNVHWVHKDINFMKYNFDMVKFINYCKIIAFKYKDF